MKAERDNTDGYIEGIDYNPSYAKAYPNNCAVIEKTADGKSIGACTFYLFQENHTVCPRHGKVKRDTMKPDLSITEVASLLREVISMHADPTSAEYNMCDSAPCNWCERAQKVCDALTPIPRLAAEQQDSPVLPPSTGSATWCGLKDDPTFVQCCCNCKHLYPVHYHCCTEPKPTEEQKKAAGIEGRCVCGVQKGWACHNPEMDGRIYDNWPQHSCGCECYESKSTNAQIEPQPTPCPYCGGNCVPGQCELQNARTSDCGREFRKEDVKL